MTNPLVPPTPPAKIHLPFKLTVTASSLILVTIMLVAAAYIWASVSKADAQKEYLAKWAAYQASVVQPALLRATIDSIKSDSAIKVANHANVVAAQQSIHIKVLKDSAATLDQHNRDLAAQLGTLPDTGTINLLVHGLQAEVAVQKTTIDTLQQKDSTRKVEIASLRFSNITMSTSNDSLKAIIRNWPVPQPPKKILGFLPQLSPKQTAIGSAILGVIVGYKINR